MEQFAKMHKIRPYLFALSLCLMVPVAHATLFTLDTTIGAGNDEIAASADFTWNGNTLELVLTNDTDGVSKTIQELTGINFILSGSPTLQSVTGSALGGAVSCIGVAAGASCLTDGTVYAGPIDPFSTPPDLANNGTSPTGWSSLPGYALFTFGAGGGSWKPWGIVNDSVVGSGNMGNTGNPTHNPMLLGPVEFDFVFADFVTPPNITGVEFYWGSGGDHRSGVLCVNGDCPNPREQNLPEPGTVTLLGVALFGLAWFTRGRRRGNAR